MSTEVMYIPRMSQEMVIKKLLKWADYQTRNNRDNTLLLDAAAYIREQSKLLEIYRND